MTTANWIYDYGKQNLGWKAEKWSLNPDDSDVNEMMDIFVSDQQQSYGLHHLVSHI